MKSQILKVKVIPNSAKNQIVGWEENILKIKIQAPPVDGKANDFLIKFLAKELKLKKKDIVLKSGDTSRYKVLMVNGLDSKNLKDFH